MQVNVVKKMYQGMQKVEKTYPKWGREDYQGWLLGELCLISLQRVNMSRTEE